MNVCVLIPAFNPNESLLKLLDEISIAKFDIVLVNDGSKSLSVFEQVNQIFPDVCVLHHLSNTGKGSALKTGFKHILKNYSSNTVLVTVDSDGQHLPADVFNIVDKLLKNPETILLGARSFAKGVPMKSYLGNRITSFIFKLCFGMYIPDTQTGLRGIPYHYLSRLIEIRGERYEYETEMMVFITKNKLPFVCIPIETVYIDQNQATNFNPISDSFKILTSILKNL